MRQMPQAWERQYMEVPNNRIAGKVALAVYTDESPLFRPKFSCPSCPHKLRHQPRRHLNLRYLQTLIPNMETSLSRLILLHPSPLLPFKFHPSDLSGSPIPHLPSLCPTSIQVLVSSLLVFYLRFRRCL